MTSPDRPSIFRKESLDRLSSPERLDRLMQVVTPRAWVGLLGLGLLITGAGVWSILGRLPQRVSATGVLLNDSQIVDLQSPIDGQIMQLNIREGDCLVGAPTATRGANGALVATIDPSDLKQQRQQQGIKLAKLQADHQAATTLETQRMALETRNLEQARSQLEARLRDAQALNPELRDRSNVATAEQRKSLRQQIEDVRKTGPILKERWERRRFLLEKGAITQDVVLGAQQEYQRNQQEIARLEAQLKTLDVSETETEQRYLNTFATIANIEAQLRSLESQMTQLQQQMLTAQSARETELLAVTQAIQQLEKQVADNSRILTPHTGCVTEMKVALGQVVGKGSPLARIQLEDPNSRLEALSYFPLSDGKQIQPGMSVQVVPSPVKRERFGAIMGEVTAVSSLPSSRDAIARRVGNDQLADLLVKNGPPLEVRIALQKEPKNTTGYAWTSSQGPQTLPMTSGMMTTSWITLESRPPITFVMPILRQQFGLE
ncbi:MAG: NHLP bacteriocin system secretion protein [Coleofasciculaceae cyanobacterium RL_1_1]|nr:NHLP bacteriocin system secretion protein [Coleofasciculaceae cyanobacterium RL_1_1]